MKKAGLAVSTILFSLCLAFPSLSFADKGHGHGESSDHGKGSMGHQKMEEGSGSSAMESSAKGKEYESGHEGEEEGSFSYKRHRKEMQEKKAMEEGSSMGSPAAASEEKMEEGSGMR
ncbi:MAG: hypothetical protein NPINA01_14340 [Nitrospinaceae bacterium]|nr:MAG: hypothetical protein NPINA01_14340 [Nitrospinaceae bacterium]